MAIVASPSDVKELLVIDNGDQDHHPCVLNESETSCSPSHIARNDWGRLSMSEPIISLPNLAWKKKSIRWIRRLAVVIILAVVNLFIILLSIYLSFNVGEKRASESSYDTSRLAIRPLASAIKWFVADIQSLSESSSLQIPHGESLYNKAQIEIANKLSRRPEYLYIRCTSLETNETIIEFAQKTLSKFQPPPFIGDLANGSYYLGRISAYPFGLDQRILPRIKLVVRPKIDSKLQSFMLEVEMDLTEYLDTGNVFIVSERGEYFSNPKSKGSVWELSRGLASSFSFDWGNSVLDRMVNQNEGSLKANRGDMLFWNTYKTESEKVVFFIVLTTYEIFQRGSSIFVGLTLGLVVLDIIILQLMMLRAHNQRAKLKEDLQDQRLKDISDLMERIVPPSIASRLLVQSSDQPIASYHHEVSILFADLVGFTTMSATMDAHSLVDLLDMLFRRVDAMAIHYDVEKIKTIGDCYFAVCNCPKEIPDHCFIMVTFGRAILTIAQQVGMETEKPLVFRVGIHCGPVVAGVIGKIKFAYDVWGDAVNVASRMESTGVPGSIQVSDRVYRSTHLKFNYQARDMIYIKGKKDPMQTYLLRDAHLDGSDVQAAGGYVIWSDREYSVGIPVIDKQHKKLFTLLNRLVRMSEKTLKSNPLAHTRSLQSVMTQLWQYVLYHFSYEERLMEMNRVPELEEHKKLHACFREETTKVFQEWTTGVIDDAQLKNIVSFLTDWLANHIKGQDKHILRDCTLCPEENSDDVSETTSNSGKFRDGRRTSSGLSPNGSFAVAQNGVVLQNLSNNNKLDVPTALTMTSITSGERLDETETISEIDVGIPIGAFLPQPSYDPNRDNPKQITSPTLGARAPSTAWMGTIKT